MKLFTLLTTLIVPIGSLAAKSPNGDVFASSRSKQLSSSGNPLKLDDNSYAELTKTPRDYSVAVLLTALDARFGCGLCHDFQKEWDALGRSWTKGDKRAESRLIFGTLDFFDGKQTFQTLMVQTAPILLLFHPTTGPHARSDASPQRFDFAAGYNHFDISDEVENADRTARIDKAEPVHAFLSRSLPDRPHPKFTRPFNYFRVGLLVTVALGLLSFVVVAAPYALPVIQNRNIWAALSIIAILLFNAGYMFNQIRSPPYVTGDGKGKISYFIGGFQNQTGLETQIVAAMYGVLSFATISLALKVPRMSDPRRQQVAVFVWGAVILSVYSFLLNIFRVKNGGYPFWLPPFF